MSLRCQCCNKQLKDNEHELCQECNTIVQEVHSDPDLQEILDEVYYENNNRDFE